MRNAALLLVAVIFAVPFSAFAQGTNPPALVPAECPKGASTGNPTETKLFVDGVTTDVPIKDFMARKLYCPNACYSVRVTIARATSGDKEAMQFKVVGTNDCKDATKLPKDQTPPRGCEKGQTQPTVIVDVPKISFSLPIIGETVLLAGQTVGPKSRCSAVDILKTVNNVFDKLGTRSPGTIKTAQADIDALKQTPNTATPLPNSAPEQTAPDPTVAAQPAPDKPTPSTADTLAQTLQTKFGVPEEQAKALVASDADKIQAMIDKTNANDTAGAQAIAKTLNLNDDVMKNIAQMQPAQQTPEERPAETPAATDKPNQNTFPQTAQSNPGLPTQCGTDGLAGNIMYAESRCAQINSNPLSSVQGPYHFLCGTWTAYANSTGNSAVSDCSNRNDPAISTMVMNAKMDQFASQYGSQCSQAGLSITSCQYAIHVFGETGFKGLYNSYLNNPNDSAFSVCGSAVSNAACSNNSSIFRNGGTVAGIFGELDKRLGGNGTVIPNINQNASPFTGFTSGTGFNTSNGSPFGGVNPFFGGTGTSAFTGGTTPSGNGASYGYRPSTGSYQSPLSSFFSNLFGSGTQAPVQTPAQQVPYQTPQNNQQAVVSIIAQPQNAFVGNFIVVSWSSVGMRSATPCTTYVVTNSGTSTVATTNEGSKIITAGAKGLMRFTISCTTLAGQTVTQATAVAVQ